MECRNISQYSSSLSFRKPETVQKSHQTPGRLILSLGLITSQWYTCFQVYQDLSVTDLTNLQHPLTVLRSHLLTPLPSALGVIFSSFHFSFKCLPHLEILKNNLPQCSPFMSTRSNSYWENVDHGPQATTDDHLRPQLRLHRLFIYFIVST